VIPFIGNLIKYLASRYVTTYRKVSQSKSIVAMSHSNCIVIIPQSFETTDFETLFDHIIVRCSIISESDFTTHFSDYFYIRLLLNVSGINSYLTKYPKN